MYSQRRGLRLDRDAALALEVHRVEHLRLHLAVGQAAAALDQAIGERRLAVVDVRDDGKIADVLHASGAERSAWGISGANRGVSCGRLRAAEQRKGGDR